MPTPRALLWLSTPIDVVVEVPAETAVAASVRINKEMNLRNIQAVRVNFGFAGTQKRQERIYVAPDSKAIVPDGFNYGTEDEPKFSVTIPATLSFALHDEETESPRLALRLLDESEGSWGVEQSIKGLFRDQALLPITLRLVYPIVIAEDEFDRAQQAAA